MIDRVSLGRTVAPGSAGHRQEVAKPGRSRALLLGWLSLACVLSSNVRAGEAALPQKSSELYALTNLWNVHLQLSAEQWEAMEPEGGGGPFGGRGGPGRPGGFGGPERLMRGPGGPGGGEEFGPAMFLAPAFLKQGDLDHDGKFSAAEFAALGEKWFTTWDKSKSGKLDTAQIRSGLNSVAEPPNSGPPGGGPGRRGGGMMLQGAEGKRNGLASAMGIEFKYVHGDVEFQGQRFTNVAVRYKGNGTFMESRGSLKRSLKVDLNHFVKGQKLAGITKLNLHNSVTDASWMNEVLSYRLYRDAGVPAPHSAYTRVFVTVPGKFDHQYLGLYSIVEDVDKHFVQKTIGLKEGAIFKPVTPNMFGDLGDDWKNYKQTYDPKTELTDQEKRRLIDFCRFVTKADDAQFAARLGDYVDLEEFSRFMAVMVWLSDLDGILGPGQNLYLYLHPKSQKLVFIPWDQDHSFGQFGMVGSQEQREQLSIHQPWREANPFLERVFKVEAFKKMYLTRLSEFSQTIFKPERLAMQVDELASVLRPAVREESEDKLARFDQVVAGNSPPNGGGPGFGRGFGQPTKPIKPFAKIRSQSVSDQLAGKSEGEKIVFGFGGPGRRGGPGGPGGPRNGGGPPDDFGPGMFLGPGFVTELDANKDGSVSHEEFTQGFAKWFQSWNSDHSGLLTEAQLRAGINHDLDPMRNGPPGGFGEPPPGSGPDRE